jgi:hypothetical protein
MPQKANLTSKKTAAFFAVVHVVSATVTSGDHSLGMMNTSKAAVRRLAVDDLTVLREWAPTVPCKPSFMVIGGPKCGSTSLFEYLEAHPQVHRPAEKELCFFSEFKRHLRRYQPGIPTTSWPLYQAAFAGKSALRLRTNLDFGGGRGRWRGRGRGRGRGRERRQWRAPEAGRRLALGAISSDTNRSERHASLKRAVSDAAAECSKQHAFEGCPFYLGEVRAAGLLYRAFPQLRVVAVLRNPRERTVSAFNDYVRMGRIHAHEATRGGLEELIRHKVALVASGNRSLEDFDVRILTSGVYIHGLRSWGEVWPTRQLLVLRSEDMFADAVGVMKRVQDFLQLPRAIPSSRVQRVANRNSHSVKAKPSRSVNATLDAFFAPYNAQLYAWMEVQGRQFKPWD